jgi:hypothetical protein
VKRVEARKKGVGNVNWDERNDGQVFTDALVNSDVRTKDWFITLRPWTAPDVLQKVEELSEQPIPKRHGQVAKLIRHEITRIEREKWKLV